MRDRDGLPPLEGWPPDVQGRPLTITEILHLGRARNALGHQALVEARREPSSGIAPDVVKAGPATYLRQLK